MAPEDVKHLVDIEADLDDRHLSQVRFGRSRFLRTAGLALFGLATGLAAGPREAGAAPAPKYCRGAPGCNCCERSVCCSSGCVKKAFTCGGNHCWRVAVPAPDGCTDIYKCCDWRKRNGEICICRDYVGRQC